MVLDYRRLSDTLLTRLIATTSQDFINTIRRSDLTPSADWTDNFFDYRDYWWIRGGQFVPYYSGQNISGKLKTAPGDLSSPLSSEHDRISHA